MIFEMRWICSRMIPARWRRVSSSTADWIIWA